MTVSRIPCQTVVIGSAAVLAIALPFFVSWGYRHLRILWNLPKSNQRQYEKGDEEHIVTTKTDVNSSNFLSSLRSLLVNVEAGSINQVDCAYLIEMLRSETSQIVCDGLVLVNKLTIMSPSTREVINKNGIFAELKRILISFGRHDNEIRELVIQAINNLALYQTSHSDLAGVIDPLMDAGVFTDSTISTQLLAFQALTNVAVSENNHPLFTRVIQQIYVMLDRAAIRCPDSSDISQHLVQRSRPKPEDYSRSVSQQLLLQVCKLLVNLSTGRYLLPYLLAAKAPQCTYQLFDKGKEDLALRWLRFLVNLCRITLDENLLPSQLPALFKAESPETMYSHLFSIERSQLICKTILSTKYTNTELSRLSSELYSLVIAITTTLPSSP